MILVVAHDAGGAEVIASWIRRNPGNYKFALAGPAVSVFQRKLGGIDVIPSVSAAESPDWVLCGTGWQSDWEIAAIEAFRAQGIRVVALLDHWLNYRERFRRGGKECLPDEIWVTDSVASALAFEAFPNVPIKELNSNPAVLDFVAEFQQEESLSCDGVLQVRKASRCVLFIGENLSGHGRATHGDDRYYGGHEIEAFMACVEHFVCAAEEPATLRLRPHPSEPASKYLEAAGGLLDRNTEVETSTGTLAADVAWSDVVVGMTSMALAFAVAAGRRSISMLPADSRISTFRIPGVEVRFLAEYRGMVEK